MSFRELHVLSLGAGVQSTAVYLMNLHGWLIPRFDCAIFADTREEPRAVYEHLDWLRSLNGPHILTGSAGRLGEDLQHGRNSTGGRFAAIPAFVKHPDGTVGHTRRQCSKEYKTEVIGRVLRQQVLGLAPGRAPTNVRVYSYIGISADEAGRAVRMERNIPTPRYLRRVFPLLDRHMTRKDCLCYIASCPTPPPHVVPWSSCVFCPYHNDARWEEIRSSPVDWERAVEIDRALRSPGAVDGRAMRGSLYLHRSCVPLDLVQLNPQPADQQMTLGFWAECEGVCGV